MPTVLQRNKGRPKMFAIRTLGERQEGKLTLSTKWLTFFLKPPDGVFSLKGHRKLDAYLKLGPTDRIWEQTLSEKIKLWMVFFSPAYIGQKRLSLWYCSVKVASVVSHQICREFQKVDKYYSSPDRRQVTPWQVPVGQVPRPGTCPPGTCLAWQLSCWHLSGLVVVWSGSCLVWHSSVWLLSALALVFLALVR